MLSVQPGPWWQQQQQRDEPAAVPGWSRPRWGEAGWLEPCRQPAVRVQQAGALPLVPAGGALSEGTGEADQRSSAELGRVVAVAARSEYQVCKEEQRPMWPKGGLLLGRSKRQKAYRSAAVLR